MTRTSIVIGRMWRLGWSADAMMADKAVLYPKALCIGDARDDKWRIAFTGFPDPLPLLNWGS